MLRRLTLFWLWEVIRGPLFELQDNASYSEWKKELKEEFLWGGNNRQIFWIQKTLISKIFALMIWTANKFIEILPPIEYTFLLHLAKHSFSLRLLLLIMSICNYIVLLYLSHRKHKKLFRLFFPNELWYGFLSSHFISSSSYLLCMSEE
jgi:hypothetical protein